MARSLSSEKKPIFAILVPKTQVEDYWNKILSGIKKAEKAIMEFGVEIFEFFFDQVENQGESGL